MKNATTLYLHALTPLHSGTGQTAAVIDLPIAREKTTGWPVIPAAGFKGVLRNGRGLGRDSQGKRIADPSADFLYGVADGDDTHAGELQFSDMHLLFFPARSLYGTFAYLTCPLALTRFLREAKALAPPGQQAAFTLPTGPATIEKVLVANGSKLVEDPQAQTKRVILDDLDLTLQEGADGSALADYFATQLFTSPEEKELFKKRFALVHDDFFTYLTAHACEVTARVALESELKMVKNLWYEEAVPAEAIFHGPMGLAGRRAEVTALPALPELVQLGGKESVGRGLCRLIKQGGA